MENSELIMYIVINKDLGMSTGKVAAQASHSCGTYIYNIMNSNNETQKDKLKEWFNDSQKKIVLGAHQKDMLKLEAQGFVSIHDNGLTEIPAGSLTSICLGIDTKENLKSVTKRFQLL